MKIFDKKSTENKTEKRQKKISRWYGLIHMILAALCVVSGLGYGSSAISRMLCLASAVVLYQSFVEWMPLMIKKSREYALEKRHKELNELWNDKTE